MMPAPAILLVLSLNCAAEGDGQIRAVTPQAYFLQLSAFADSYEALRAKVKASFLEDRPVLAAVPDAELQALEGKVPPPPPMEQADLAKAVPDLRKALVELKTLRDMVCAVQLGRRPEDPRELQVRSVDIVARRLELEPGPDRDHAHQAYDDRARPAGAAAPDGASLAELALEAAAVSELLGESKLDADLATRLNAKAADCRRRLGSLGLTDDGGGALGVRGAAGELPAADIERLKAFSRTQLPGSLKSLSPAPPLPDMDALKAKVAQGLRRDAILKEGAAGPLGRLIAKLFPSRGCKHLILVSAYRNGPQDPMIDYIAKDAEHRAILAGCTAETRPMRTGQDIRDALADPNATELVLAGHSESRGMLLSQENGKEYALVKPGLPDYTGVVQEQVSDLKLPKGSKVQKVRMAGCNTAGCGVLDYLVNKSAKADLCPPEQKETIAQYLANALGVPVEAKVGRYNPVFVGAPYLDALGLGGTHMTTLEPSRPRP